MTPISQDPARRIRRLARHIARYQARLTGWILRNGNPPAFSDGNVDLLYAKEMAFVTSLAVEQQQAIAEQKARIEELTSQLETERAVLGDVKSWADECVKELVDETWNLGTETEEQDEKIGELKARIEELENNIIGLREGLEDIKTQRRIGSLADIEDECDFYLTRES